MQERPILKVPRARVGLLFSGGLDSTAALALLRDEGHDVKLIEVEHASRPNGERAAAELIAAHFDSPRVVVRIDVPLAGRTSPRPSALLLASIAEHAARALSINNVVMATVREDWEAHGEPEAAEYYLSTVQRLLRLHASDPVRLHVPFRGRSKAELAAAAAAIGAPLELAWSCVVGDEKRCGSCVPCLEARAAIAGV